MWTLFLITVLSQSVTFTEGVSFSAEKYCLGEEAIRNEKWKVGEPIYACLDEKQIAMIKAIPSVNFLEQQTVPSNYYNLSRSIRNARKQ